VIVSLTAVNLAHRPVMRTTTTIVVPPAGRGSAGAGEVVKIGGVF